MNSVMERAGCLDGYGKGRVFECYAATLRGKEAYLQWHLLQWCSLQPDTIHEECRQAYLLQWAVRLVEHSWWKYQSYLLHKTSQLVGVCSHSSKRQHVLQSCSEMTRVTVNAIHCYMFVLMKTFTRKTDHKEQSKPFQTRINRLESNHQLVS